MEKWLFRISLVITGLFIIIVAIPLSVERFSLTRGWKTLFTDFQLIDQHGKVHHGFIGQGRLFIFDLQMLEYGYETPGGKDLHAWRKKVSGNVFRPDYGKDGFHWADKGFLWAGPVFFNKGGTTFREGDTMGYQIRINEQSEILLPGAPLDARSPKAAQVGKFPEYNVHYEDDYFLVDLLYRARAKGWYLWNHGVPFQAGDFGLGSMNELPCNVSGTIVHKKENKTFRVNGTGLIEDALGLPWNWFDWGTHDWFSCNFPNGWACGLWKAQDDWQWGYNRYPEEAWIYDPEKREYYTAHRLELVEKEMAWDDLNGFEYPKSYRWRAITEAGTLDISARSITYKPIRWTIPFSPFSVKLAYGRGVFEGRFIRRDGTTIELNSGAGTLEHFINFFPDQHYICPILLILVIFSWGGTSAVRQVKNGKGWRRELFVMSLFILGVIYLFWKWS